MAALRKTFAAMQADGSYCELAALYATDTQRLRSGTPGGRARAATLTHL
jgi:hypothetical protein